MIKWNALWALIILALLGVLAVKRAQTHDTRTCFMAKGVAAMRDASMYEATSEGVKVTALRADTAYKRRLGGMHSTRCDSMTEATPSQASARRSTK